MNITSTDQTPAAKSSYGSTKYTQGKIEGGEEEQTPRTPHAPGTPLIRTTQNTPHSLDVSAGGKSQENEKKIVGTTRRHGDTTRTCCFQQKRARGLNQTIGGGMHTTLASKCKHVIISRRSGEQQRRCGSLIHDICKSIPHYKIP